MATYKPVLQNYKRKDGLSLIQIRITADRKTTYAPTSLYVRALEWNEKKGEVRTLSSLHEVYNAAIKKMISTGRKKEGEAILKGEKLTAEKIKQILVGKNTGASFNYLATEYINSRKGIISERTAERYLTHLSSFIKFAKEALPHQITKEFISKYEPEALKERSENTIHRGIKALAGIWGNLQEAGEINPGPNPFKGASVKSRKAEKQRLTLQEIEKMRLADLSGTHAIARDVFLLQYFLGGLRISDVLLLKGDNIQEGRIEYSDMKTGRQQSHIIPDQALEILQKHLPTKGYVLPLMTFTIEHVGFIGQIEAKTSLVNKYLKEVAKKLEINKHITSHVARHTFADHLRQSDASLYTISKALGHSSVKMTENYLESFDNKAVDDATNKLFKA